MLESLLGSLSKERVLLYLHARKDGNANQMARYFETDLSPIQKQLERLEEGGVLASRMVGRTRLYSFNPSYSFQSELQKLLGRALSFYPREEMEKLLDIRRRPRRKGKPL